MRSARERTRIPYRKKLEPVVVAASCPAIWKRSIHRPVRLVGALKFITELELIWAMLAPVTFVQAEPSRCDAPVATYSEPLGIWIRQAAMVTAPALTLELVQSKSTWPEPAAGAAMATSCGVRKLTSKKQPDDAPANSSPMGPLAEMREADMLAPTAPDTAEAATATSCHGM